MPGDLVDLELFLGWLRRLGAPESDLPTYRRGARSIIDLAEGQRVTSEHVAAALARGRSSGMTEVELTNLLKIGNYLIRFQGQGQRLGGERPARAAAGRSVSSTTLPVVQERVRNPPTPDPDAGGDGGSGLYGPSAISGLVRLPLPEPPPDAMSRSRDVVFPGGGEARRSGAPEPRGRAAELPDEGRGTAAPAPPPAVDEAAGDDGPSQEEVAVAGDESVEDDLLPVRHRRPWVALAAVALVVGLGVVGGRALLARRASPPPTVPPPTAAARPAAIPAITRLPGLPLEVKLPPGWRAGGQRSIVVDARPPVAAVVIYRGGQAGEPRSELLVAVLPANGGGSDQALLAETGRGHAGAVALLRARHTPVEAQGCRIATVGGRRAGVCAGRTPAAGGAGGASLRTYLIVGRGRELLALLIDRSGGPGAGEADTLLASVTER